jgi:hypothetical protein
VFAGTGAGGAPTLATVEGEHSRIAEYALRQQTEAAAAAKPGVELTALPPDEQRSAWPFAHGDIDGDGDQDVVLADPKRARLMLLLEDTGAFALRTVPSLSGIGSVALSDVDGDGRADLLLASPEEPALAWVKGGAGIPDAFPTRLPAAEQPLAAQSHGDAILFLARDERRQGALYRIARTGDSFGPAEKLLELERMPEAPLRLLVADLDGQHGADVAFVQPGQGLFVLLAAEAGGYRAAAKGQALMKVDDGAVTLVEHEGAPALLVARGRFARRLRFDRDGEAIVLAQENGPEGIAEISLVRPLQNGAQTFVDNQANKVWLVEPGRTPRSIDLPRLGPSHVLEHHDAVLVLSKTGVLRVPFHGATWCLQRLREHEPPTEETDYYGGLAADFDGDGTAELAVGDDEIHGLHLLVADGERLERALSFPVFELPETGSGNYEPRGMAAGDLDGDGRIDLALLCHDRVLIYTQAK